MQNKCTTSCVTLLPSGGRVIQSNGAQIQQNLVLHDKANTTTLSLLPSSVRVLTSKDGKSQHTVSLRDKVTTTGVTRLLTSIRVITTNALQSQHTPVSQTNTTNGLSLIQPGMRFITENAAQSQHAQVVQNSANTNTGVTFMTSANMVQSQNTQNSTTTKSLSMEQQRMLTENPPLLCFLDGNISICQGCRTKFAFASKNPLNNLLLKMMVARDRLINGQYVQSWQKNWGYFHLNINCLQRKYSFLEISDIYIPNNIRCSLQMCHTDKLKQMGWWDQMHVRHFCSRCVNHN